jgi:hypothetical protein
MTLLVLTSNIFWLWAAVRKYEISTIVVGFGPIVEYKRCRGLPLLSNGYWHVLIRSTVQEICFIKVDEMLLEFCMGQIRGNWLFQNFDEESKWNLRKLWIPNL